MKFSAFVSSVALFGVLLMIDLSVGGGPGTAERIERENGSKY